MNFFSDVIAGVATILFSTVGDGAIGKELPVEYQAYRPAVTARMHDFPLGVVRIEPRYDMTQPDEPIMTCVVIYELIYESHPALESFDSRDEMKEIFAFGGWGSKDALVHILQDYSCFR